MIFPREVSNRLLLLYLLSHLEGCKETIRLQTIVFQVQRKTRKLGWTSRTFNYKFIRWSHGAYSKELSMDLKLLINKGLLEADSNKVTQIATKYLDSAKAVGYLDLIPIDSFKELAQSLNQTALPALLLQIYEESHMREFKMGKVMQDTLYTIP